MDILLAIYGNCLVMYGNLWFFMDIDGYLAIVSLVLPNVPISNIVNIQMLPIVIISILHSREVYGGDYKLVYIIPI